MDMTPGAYHVRQPLPTSRAIEWTHVRSRPGGGGVIEDGYAIFVTQSALRDIQNHLWSSPEQEQLGFLLGDLCECPDTGSRYIVISATMRTDYVIPEDAIVQIPDELWHAVHLEARLRRGTLLGWYHSAPYIGDFPTLIDRETHRCQFDEPWMTGLVVVPDAERPDGGFFRAGDSTLTRGAFQPFYELLDEDVRPIKRHKVSVIAWEGYDTTDAVVRPTPKPAAVPLNAGAGFVMPGTAGIPSDPAGTTPASLPLLFPPEAYEEAPPKRGFGQRVAFVTGAAALVVASILGVATVTRWAPSSEPEIEPIRIPTVNSPPAPANAPPKAAPTTTPAAPPGPAVTPADEEFDRLGTALELAIRNYYDRRTDFSLGRLTCEGLARGYQNADDAQIVLASRYGELGPGVGAEQAKRYRELAAAMNAVNADFDESGCPRP